MNELSKRILVAIFGIPVITVLIFLGQWYFFGLVLLISLIAQWEFYAMQKRKDIRPQVFNGLLSGILLLLGIQTGEWGFWGSLLIPMLIIILSLEMIRYHEKVSINIGVTLVGIFYIPVMLGTLISTMDYINHAFNGVVYAGSIFIIVLLVTIWLCDTFAYAFGILFGKHKLNEQVSPNKTIEGAIAGLSGAVLSLVLVKAFDILPVSWLSAILIGLAVGLIGQTGDLVESWFKRDAGVKDSSTLLPGHGGMLDRFDSLIFIAPVMYLMVRILF